MSFVILNIPFFSFLCSITTTADLKNEVGFKQQNKHVLFIPAPFLGLGKHVYHNFEITASLYFEKAFRTKHSKGFDLRENQLEKYPQ
ncbi:hypothetical protein BSK58_25025 [Paenibacillus odorifer]|nr:hypothetical protein BSK58_25025 [Paenibacillus odorifer]